MKAIFMETTGVSVDRTIGEIQAVLVRYGAGQIQTEYADGQITALRFRVQIKGSNIPFMLPCRWSQVKDAIIKRREASWSPNLTEYQKKGLRERAFKDLEVQARRVAWRQVLRWVEAQFAMVETEMVKLEEVFMPYIVMDKKGTTLFEVIDKRGAGFLLEAPKS